MTSRISKILNFAGSILDPRAYLHILRLIHYSGYSHVRERGKITKGKGTGIAPNVSLRNGERIAMGHDCHIGERCYLWAGDSTGRIILGNYVSLAPEVFITASDYRFEAGKPFRQQSKRERDIRIGNDMPASGALSPRSGERHPAVGLDNVRARIARLYPDAASLHAGIDDHGRYCVAVTLPLRFAPAQAGPETAA